MDLKACISRRLREVRQELYGEHGGPEMARRLGLPARTWYNYESGVTVPAEVLLSFIDQTGANPIWLFSGLGPRYLRGSQGPDQLAPIDLIRRCLECLLEDDPRPSVVDVNGEEDPSLWPEGCVHLPLVSAESLMSAGGPTEDAPRHVLASRRWIANPESTYAIRLEDDEMEPILPMGSILGVDCSMTDPPKLQGRLVLARHEGKPLVRLLELSHRHLILKASKPGRDTEMIPVPWSQGSPSPLLGQVVWSWTRFGH